MQRTPAEKNKDFQKIYFAFSLISAKFSFFSIFLSLFTFVCLMYQQYNDTFHELRMQLENQVVQIP